MRTGESDLIVVEDVELWLIGTHDVEVGDNVVAVEQSEPRGVLRRRRVLAARRRALECPAVHLIPQPNPPHQLVLLFHHIELGWSCCPSAILSVGADHLAQRPGST